uniref:Uncharacterized protein n=1 Tax=Oscillatoriales cyanobacterium SpSt-402 TaxID=2282168 RepID=A0A832H5H6_9CYAN
MQGSFKTFICEYRFNNPRWGFEIKAASLEEAEQRLRSLSQGRVLGELKAVIPYQLGWLAKLWFWVGNLFRV